ncbi:MAG: ABC transporter substrate-binding protein [Acidaminococcales bacterium]|jgi:branched-chain amino acid transport system substrate-binding protein|nr:ABC transporter substrate-binding protein [Acidaminococcales bacterium]
MFKITKFAAALSLAAAVLAGAACGWQKPPQPTDEIRIGGNLELTGGSSLFGQSIHKGLKLAFKEVNGKGGINGRKVILIVADNKSEAPEAANATVKLIAQDKVSAIVGPATSSPVLACASIVTERKIPLLTPSGTNENITFLDGKTRDFLFRGCFIDPLQGEIMAKFALNNLNLRKMAIYSDISSDYAKKLAAAYRSEFEKKGGQIVAEEAYQQKDTDFRPVLTKIRAAGPEGIFVPGYYQEVGTIIKQAREFGITMPLLGSDGWDSPKILELAGAAALNNTYFCDHYSVEDLDPNIQKFVKNYKAEYNGETPDAFAALGYDSGLIVADAVRRAGGGDPEKIRDALAATKDLQVATGKLTMDARHNPIKGAVIIAMQDGKQVFKEKIN